MHGTMEAIACFVFCFVLPTPACKLVLVKNACVNVFKKTGQCCPPQKKKIEVLVGWIETVYSRKAFLAI